MTAPRQPDGPNAEQAEFWSSDAGEKWARLQARLDALFAPVTEALLARAAIAPGESVLDIGCGAGDTTLAAADRAGATGRVLGVDISDTLLAVARRRAAGRGNVGFTLADAQTHRFAAAAHDLLLSRFGLMFFADPVAAFANIARALRPGARAVFASWAAVEHNPWSHVAAAAGTARLGPVAPVEPRAPGQFAFAEIGYVTEILAAAGLAGAEGAALDIRLPVADTAAEAADLATRIGPVSRILREKAGTETDRRAIAADIARTFARWEGPDGVRVPARINLFTARLG